MSNGNYTVRRFRPEDKPVLIDLVGQVWNEDTSRRLALQWDWKYDRNPQNPPGGHDSIILECDGQAVGWIGFLSADIKVGDRIVPMAWGSDLSVHPEHRGRGWLVLKYITEHGEKICAGASIPEKIYQIYKRLGGIDATTYVSYKQVLVPERFLAAKGMGRLRVMAGSLGLAALRRVMTVLRWRSDMRKIRLVPLTEFDARFDEFWERVSPGYDLITVRDAAFLNWRFRDCPNRHYESFAAIRDGELAGYVVVRAEDDGDLRRGYVVDLLTARGDHAALQRLLDQAELFARGQCCDTLGFTTSVGNTEMIRQLKRHCFLFKTLGRKMIAHGGGPEGYRDLMPVFADAQGFHLTRADSDSDYSYGGIGRVLVRQPEAEAVPDPRSLAPDPA